MVYCYYAFVIERPDGSTYEQIAPDIVSLISILGPDYLIVDVYDNREDF